MQAPATAPGISTAMLGASAVTMHEFNKVLSNSARSMSSPLGEF